MNYILSGRVSGRALSDGHLWGHYKTKILKFTWYSSRPAMLGIIWANKTHFGVKFGNRTLYS